MTDIAEMKAMKREAERKILAIIADFACDVEMDVVGIDITTVTQMPVSGNGLREAISDVRIKVEMP